MKILLSVFLLFVLGFSQAFSQSSDSLNYCVVVLNDSGVYVPSMKLRVVSFKKEDDFLKNSTTDFSGTACLTLAHGRVYNLIIDDSLYTRVKKKITFDNIAKFLSDTIFLSAKITSTDVINVEAQKDFMHIEDDKMVYDISKMKIDPGPNGLELMKKIPMVSVDGENVLLRGNSVKILFDGREQNMYGDLRSIPTEMIEKIEVMTVVPARYEAEGIDGVINVVLKKMDDAKYRVSLGGWGNTNNYGNLNQSVNLKKDKTSLFLNTSERLSNPPFYSYNTRRNISTGEILLLSTDTNKNNTKAFRINPGIIYDIDQNLYFGLEGVLNISNTDGSNRSYREYSYLPNEVQQLLRVGALDEVERRHLQRALQAVDNLDGLLLAQGFFQHFARIVDATRADVLFRHGELIRLLHDSVAFRRADFFQVGDLKRHLLDVLLFQLLEDIRADLGSQGDEEDRGFLLTA